MWDLDRDGDLDIVVSRVGNLYVGTAIQIIENKGDGKFKSQLIEIVAAPSTFETPKDEGNAWNSFVDAIRFGDVDGDGDDDIILHGGRSYRPELVHKVRASILRNDGDFEFTHIVQSDSRNPVTTIDDSLFISDPSAVLGSFKIAKEGKEKSTKSSRMFARWFEANEGVELTDPYGYSFFPKPVSLKNSGAIVLGYKQFTHTSYVNRSAFKILVKYGGKTFETTFAVEKFSKGGVGFMTSFSSTDWGRINVRTGNCSSQIYFGGWDRGRCLTIKNTGIEKFLADLKSVGRVMLMNVDTVPFERRLKLISGYK